MARFVESYFCLTTSLLKKDLRKARNKEPVESEFLNFVHDGRAGVLDYSIEYSFDGNTYLVVQIGEEPQKILLAERELRFGSRSHLVCGCGKKTNGLYLKLGYFACRNCQKLHYRSTRINTKSEHGQFLYLQNRRLKLIDERENISRPIYKGNYTKRFIRWLKHCGEIGATKEVIRAYETMEAIKNNRAQKI